MSASDNSREKLLLIDWIIKQDKIQNLRAVRELIDRMDKESTDSASVVGYLSGGSKVTQSQLILRINESLKEIQNNQVISLDQLEHDSEQW